MALLGALLLAFALAACSVCRGHFKVEKSSIKVISPLSLQSKRDGAIGNFGVPKYGGTLVGSVAYPDKGVSNGCEAFDGDKPFKFKSSQPTILLLDRGGSYSLSLSNSQMVPCSSFPCYCCLDLVMWDHSNLLVWKD